MAKKSMVAREVKRKKLSLKYDAKRKALREAIRNPKSTFEQKETAQLQLQKMPRDSSAIRIRNRCAITGRPHGFYRKFGLARNKLREATMRGDVPGVVKASW
jgi:small subunit ribosomal protein S14